MLVRVLFAGALALLAAISPAFAQGADDALLDRLKNFDHTLRLEERLADALSNKNYRQFMPGVRLATASEDRAQPEVVKRLLADRAAMAKLDACQVAGLVLRGILIGVTEGRLKPARKAGVWIVDPGAPDQTYAEKARQCETVNRLPKSKRHIGSNCLADGEVCPRG